MTEQRQPLTRAQIAAALHLLPETEAQSVMAEARAADRQQKMEDAAAALRQWIRPTRTPLPKTEGEPSPSDVAAPATDQTTEE
jgi:hypothetical protein